MRQPPRADAADAPTCISALPAGVLTHIFEALGPRDLASVSCVSKPWQHLVALEAAANLLWRSFYSARWQLSGALGQPPTPGPGPAPDPGPDVTCTGQAHPGPWGSGGHSGCLPHALPVAASDPIPIPGAAGTDPRAGPGGCLPGDSIVRWQLAYGRKMLRLRSWSGRYSADQMVGHKSAVRAVRLLPSHNLLATASLDRTVRLWDLQSGLPLASSRPHGGTVRCLALDPTLLASGCTDSIVRLWHPSPGPAPALGSRPWDPPAAPLDSEAALAGYGARAQRSLSSSCRALHCPPGQPALCLDLADQWLAAGTDSGVVRMWDFTAAAAAAERASASRAARSASKPGRSAKKQPPAAAHPAPCDAAVEAQPSLRGPGNGLLLPGQPACPSAVPLPPRPQPWPLAQRRPLPCGAQAPHPLAPTCTARVSAGDGSGAALVPGPGRGAAWPAALDVAGSVGWCGPTAQAQAAATGAAEQRQGAAADVPGPHAAAVQQHEWKRHGHRRRQQHHLAHGDLWAARPTPSAAPAPPAPGEGPVSVGSAHAAHQPRKLSAAAAAADAAAAAATAP
ncbi:F-box/WD-40 repeat-containing protein [Tetrabaena socialis]|uniref:F-box/WD-40 repeat-containing protein n=1 Tax=Tetrabaena socialis TaxID=47790 RepID=A0A2J8ABE9_9CHLO|nr:F-box/WD-40 repeat-containing protein [Tetrabaena socialis]|eukprot:PNH09827.1 F-box/WD-40 repeat-containing protein [Tetrabaena socialis]